jgi:branched-chain amino acid transport system ATP-binding protein
MTDAQATQTAPVLSGSALVKRFGKLTVLSAVDFSVGPGEAVGIVGPNGAGKTTLLNALAGSVTPDAGTVTLLGQDVSALRPADRCRRGLGRAFQVPRPFNGMTVLENVIVGAAAGGRLKGAALRARSIDVLEVCGLTELANRRAATLGLLHRKRLEVARALATGPQVLLLDEIGAGLTDAEATELVDLIRHLRDTGIAVVWIEHIVHVLLEVVTRLIAMDAGVVIEQGEPQAVLSSAAVIDAYLGREGS